MFSLYFLQLLLCWILLAELDKPTRKFQNYNYYTLLKYFLRDKNKILLPLIWIKIISASWPGNVAIGYLPSQLKISFLWCLFVFFGYLGIS